MSSTEIRARVAAGKSIRGFVPEPVADLYRGPAAVPIRGVQGNAEERHWVGVRDAARARAASAFSRSSTRSTSIDERLKAVCEEELRAQTAKFRETIRERTAELEAQIAALKEPQAGRGRSDERERDRQRAQRRRRHAAASRRSSATRSRRARRILPEAFATVREAARRLVGTTVMVTGQEMTWNMVHYDVQLIGGIELHLGRIAEMATGEGKTLVATLPLYLNALPGTRRAPRHGQLVPRPPRLAVDGAPLQLPRPHGRLPRRHRAGHAGPPRARTSATSRTARTTSSASTTCATTWSSSLEQRVQRGHIFAIVDEVDSVLIDEARTPLIISGPVGNEADGEYARAQRRRRAPRAAGRPSSRTTLVARARRRWRPATRRPPRCALYQAQLGAPEEQAAAQGDAGARA